ncbi:hypothetical protein KXW98_003953 [Aspergillus fumigatus]|uniref:Uncharacterized protein n=1 Tax=Aspergillus fumigatus TaxID=746128 RepID=A0A229W5G7_ASPFM|nr:hypothetical protein KXX45_006222 [Aspergillus fumigatus]KAH1288960.1 hypothetical protein KXX48_008582 [Aspergillus fumigatus]KAH1295610.1 hypothetical protein KXX30_001310 [Aspergillus fumigatus]KAH1299868.1 hypothetical protein KXX11_006010 [Aspergillus fumigatus]KAH1312004.1 hypothetical protein KXX47_005188 [Aspergillus fumigatus]
MDSATIDYNEILDQIHTNLTNALNTFGPSSQQYQNILKILKECLQNIDNDKKERPAAIDPDTLSLAMKFLELGR